ncbi:hypothetical protein ACFQ0G_53125 [Streptomyces chiangmaiensis]|uniref:hypothetical protein n=1 Tax=Streptomyces chiangmaiensis TaxID=766497 RepID=UPI0031EBF098
MTGRAFRRQHGDPTSWTTADFESYEVFTETTLKHRLALRIKAAARTVRRHLSRRSLRLAA